MLIELISSMSVNFVSPVPNLPYRFLLKEDYAHPDSTALITHHVTSASYHQFLKVLVGFHVALLDTVATAKLMLVYIVINRFFYLTSQQ